jgi:hypothetical protein
VVGETSLIVRYSGETIDLKQVLVMENASHPVVLWMDWIGKAGAVIYVEDEKPVMNVSKNCKEKMRSPSVNREKEEVVGDDASKYRTEQEFVDGGKKAEIFSEETNNSFEKAAYQLLSMDAMVEDSEKRTVNVYSVERSETNSHVECPVC